MFTSSHSSLNFLDPLLKKTNLSPSILIIMVINTPIMDALTMIIPKSIVSGIISEVTSHAMKESLSMVLMETAMTMTMIQREGIARIMVTRRITEILKASSLILISLERQAPCN